MYNQILQSQLLEEKTYKQVISTDGTFCVTFSSVSKQSWKHFWNKEHTCIYKHIKACTQTMYILHKVVEVIDSREDISLTPQSVTKWMLSFGRHIVKHTSCRKYIHCTRLKRENKGE